MFAAAPARSDGRTDSPDNDSAFSDSISMLSGESSASSGARTSSSQESGKREGTLGINEELATAACLHDVQITQVSDERDRTHGKANAQAKAESALIIQSYRLLDSR